MPWILKKSYTFNSYVGEEGIVKNHSEAKAFKTKKSANEYSKTLEYKTEVIRVIEE